MTSSSTDSRTENELWLICPICKQPNPYGTLHCQHCWGASLYSVKPITSEELAVVTRRRLARTRRLNTIRIMAVSIVAPLLLSVTVFLGLYHFTDIVFKPPPTVNSSSLPGEWAMFRHDLSHTGSTGFSSNAPQGNLKWEFTTGGPIHSSPAVVDGTVYVGSRDWTLYALDAETGTKRWEFKAETWIDSSPAVVDGIVYFGSNDGRIYALDADTGRKLWDFKTRYAVKSSPAVADGMVYIGSDDYFIYALDTVTGTRLWSFETGSHASAAPAVANGIVYAGSMDGTLYALHSQNGRYRLGFKTFQSIVGAPAAYGSVIYVNAGGFLYAIDGNARNWPGEHDFRGWWLQFYAFRLAPPPPPISGYMWRIRLGTSSPSSPIISDGIIYTSADNNLFCMDTEKLDLDKLRGLRTPAQYYQFFQETGGWIFTAGGDIRSSPALGNNALYLGCEDGRLYAVDAATGQKLWDFTTGDKITSSPALAGDTIYVGSHDGKLYAIE